METTEAEGHSKLNTVNELNVVTHGIWRATV